MAAQTPEEKATKKFIESVSTLNFDPTMFVVMVNMCSLAVKKRVLLILILLVQSWARRYDQQMWSTQEEYAFYIDAKRADDAIQPFIDHMTLR